MSTLSGDEFDDDEREALHQIAGTFSSRDEAERALLLSLAKTLSDAETVAAVLFMIRMAKWLANTAYFIKVTVPWIGIGAAFYTAFRDQLIEWWINSGGRK